ncbi:GIY-YIG nuclease family protein [Inquilinus sp. YAF38]|uniref:GIY-YIG nuclease family protein n=1 Tax=Inquilinus sp. YAF38 TaxID=3233084 RepID=UPI003F913E65
MDKSFFVYIMASRKDGVLYTGVTSNLPKRVWEHRNKIVSGFTARYGVGRLVWIEPHENAESAIRRERQIEKWRRAWKVELIEKDNPAWADLFDSLNE